MLNIKNKTYIWEWRSIDSDTLISYNSDTVVSYKCVFILISSEWNLLKFSLRFVGNSRYRTGYFAASVTVDM